MTADARRRLGLGLGLAASLAAAALAGASGSGSVPGLRPGTGPGVGAGGAHVEAIYPTASRLPANTLRFYVVFSAPMSAGEAHTRLRLVDDRGAVVPGAFLELEEELWDPSGRRLTVLLDPGRIKRGLRANLESGAPLVAGRRYRLEVDAGWRDAHGAALSRGYVKAFQATAEDRTSPDVDAWSLQPPAPGAVQPLVVRAPEPLDRALLASAITVVDANGEAVEGEIDVADGEREWRFTPRSAWANGRYALRVGVELEDVAGNSLQRLFDLDLSRAERRTDAQPFRLRAFRVGSGT